MKWIASETNWRITHLRFSIDEKQEKKMSMRFIQLNAIYSILSLKSPFIGQEFLLICNEFKLKRFAIAPLPLPSHKHIMEMNGK